MKGVLLRGIIEVVIYALTLPLRLIVIIATICYMAYYAIRYECSFTEMLKAFAIGMKSSFLNEITLVKTGKGKGFDELMTDLTSEEES